MLIVKLRTALQLGLLNIFRVILYRLGVKLGINPVRRLQVELPQSSTFFKPLKVEDTPQCNIPYNNAWIGKHTYFGWKTVASQSPPNWVANCFSGKPVTNASSPWWMLSDFDPQTGDIKTVWEASRFDWVISLAQHAIVQRDPTVVEQLNSWIADWLNHNPMYYGPNWKCGQEASIRVMHLAMASVLLSQHKNTSAELQTLIAGHLERIAPTLTYAIAQDNNHGTSEVAALYIGGSWLAQYGHPKAKYWQSLGQKWLENRANRLIMNDGSFSQYSMTYHRLVLDTFSMIETWRRALNLDSFTPRYQERMRLASNWLYQVVSKVTGDAPNLGANDGARLFPLTNTDYRDFRPSVQLACSLFFAKAAYSSDGEFDAPLRWMNIEKPTTEMPEQTSMVFSDGGYVALRNQRAFVLLRYPNFSFRPSQSDLLHVDLWVDDVNVLRDAGTYSYNAEPSFTHDLNSIAAHNTLQFDEREPMPRLSRFLLGNWIRTKHSPKIQTSQNAQKVRVEYIDSRDVIHVREIVLNNNKLVVRDGFTGYKSVATLRWRLMPSKWEVMENTVFDDTKKLVFSANDGFELSVKNGVESRYYYKISETPVVNLTTNESTEFTTEIEF